MATVKITTTYQSTSKLSRMTIETTNGKYRFRARSAPLEVQYSGFGNVWAEVARPGKKPYLLKEASNLPKLSFTMQYAKENDPDFDCTPGLKQLNSMAATIYPVRIRYGGYYDSRIWRVTNFSFTTKRRHPTRSYPTWVEIDMEFTMANDVKLNLGPASGGVK